MQHLLNLGPLVVAQAGPSGAGGALAGMLQAFTTQLQGLAVPFAIFGVMAWAVAFLATPLLPEWASGLKGYFQRALVIVGVISFLPGIITFVASLGGGAGAGGV